MRWIVFLVVSAITWLAAIARAGELPHPTESGAERHADRNAACTACHPAIAAEWSRSLHHEAYRDPIFQKALAIEPQAFCRGCHAPESAPEKTSQLAGDVGVGCITCHQGGHGDAVVAARESGRALHDTLADMRMTTEEACASCHQFDFPDGAHQRIPEAMQNTVSEHASSAHASESCQTCHMPMHDGHRSHDFSVINSPEMLRSAVNIDTARIDETHVRIHITPAAVGHAFPTGDMFRRLEVRADRARPIILARRFLDVPRENHSGTMRVQVADTRVGPDGADITMYVGIEPAHWSVVYQRMSTPMAHAFDLSQVLDEVILAEGTN